MVIGLYGWKSLKLNDHFTKSCGHRHCGSGDIMVIVCDVISQDHLTEGWSNIMGRSPSWHITNMLSLVGIVTVAVEI